MSWQRIILVACGFVAIVLIALAVIFQDGIYRFTATPRAPFQTIEAPPPPDYALPSAWLAQGPAGADPEDAAQKPADVFYIHSTSFYRRKLWNAPFDDPEADLVRRTIALPNEAGPFAEIGEIYAPRYREATLFSLFTHKYDGLAARRLAYGDVRRAFERFLSERDKERPLIIAGYGQGGLYAQGLLREYFQGEINPLRRRLVAAYVIGAAVPEQFLDTLSPPIPACSAPDAVRCVISYNNYERRFDEEMERIRNRALLWTAADELETRKGEPILCVNPLSWKVGEDYQPRERNIGAASATGLAAGDRPSAMPGEVGARCVDGVLIVDNPATRHLRRGDWFGAKWRAQPFNLFYYDIAENAALRLKTLIHRLASEPEPLEPIGETVEVVDSPVNKAPE